MTLNEAVDPLAPKFEACYEIEEQEILDITSQTSLTHTHSQIIEEEMIKK